VPISQNVGDAITKDAASGEALTRDIALQVESFERDPAAKQTICQMLASNPRAFNAAALKALVNRPPSAGGRFVIELLNKEKMLPGGLQDETILNMDEAVTVLRMVAAGGTNLQPALELALSRVLQDPPNAENASRILRLLGLMAAIASPSSWNAFQLELMAYPDRFVRARAALVIGRSTKNVAWIGRRFLDRDTRVQASAVEALWAVDAAEARPLLLAAVRSSDNRVAANGALGLYRIADLKAIPLLLGMARQEDENFRMSALWALGETRDPRFLPFLMDQFKVSQGKVRLAVTRALACIRRHEKTLGQVGEIGIHVTEARAAGDGARSIGFVLRSSSPLNLSNMKPTEFALWENGSLIEDYEVKMPTGVATMAVGFVAPRFPSSEDPYGEAVAATLKRVSALKRPDDLWRIDRYLIETLPPGSDESPETTLPYDDAVLTPELKARQCFIAAPGLLSQAIASWVPVTRTAQNSYRALERQCAAMRKLSGKRHVFMFLHQNSIAALEDESHMHVLKEIVTQERVILHGFAPGASHDCPAFRALCLSIPDGTFSDAGPDEFPAEIENTYPLLMNACEINYRLPPGAKAGPVLMKVSSEAGAGQADIVLRTAGARAEPITSEAMR
jgi:hypothetical protein